MSARRALLLLPVLGAIGVVVWIAWPPDEARSPPSAEPAGAPARAPAPHASRLVLEGARRRSAPSLDGIDPSTGLAARAQVRFVTDDGAPAGGARASYGLYAGEDLPFEGQADAEGRMWLAAPAVGRRVWIDVAEGPGWAQERFDLWALASSTVVLAPGCRVWLTLRPQEADLVGRTCRFALDGIERSAQLTGPRTLLGAFRGSTVWLEDIDGWAAERAPHVLLGARGDIEIPWSGVGGERVRVRFQAPAEPDEALGVRLVPAGARNEAQLAPAASGTGWVEFLVPADGPECTYLASSGTWWAAGRIPSGKAAAAGPLPPGWDQGCRLEALLPSPATVLWARAFLVSLPGREDVSSYPERVLPYARILQDPASDWLDFGAELSGPENREWPVEPDITRSRIVWRSVPRGCTLRLVVAGTPEGTLSQDVEVPAGASNHEVPLRAAAAITLEVRGERATLVDAEELLHVRCSGVRGTDCAVLLPREQSRVVVRGLPVGEEAEFSVSGGGVAGTARARVEPGLVLPLVLERGALAHHDVQVVDAAGRPLAGVGVLFEASWGAYPARSDGAGRVSIDLVSDGSVRARVSDPSYVSDDVDLVSAAPTTIRAAPAPRLRLEFDLGTTWVHVGIGEDFVGSTRMRVAPGSVLTPLLLDLDSQRSLAVTVWDDAGGVLLERSLDLAASPTTTLRVTR